MNIQTIPISLYIHFPWCLSRCHYCDFNAHQSPKNIPEADYLLALINQLKAIKQLKLSYQDKRDKLTSIFIGGGTPSLVSSYLIEKTLYQVAKYFDIANCEITIEANPESINYQKLLNYRQAQINRISIGVQSFNINHLKKLSRAHDGNQAKRAISLASESIENINVDLMYGLIEQTEKEAIADIQNLLSFPVSHISYYELTLEPNTHFYHFPPKIADENLSIKMQQNAISLMQSHQFNRYEVSAYAKEDKNCLHNLNYWEFGDYWAIGAGGAGKVSYSDSGGKLQYFRYQAPKNPNQFIAWGKDLEKKSKLAIKFIDEKEKAFEFFLNSSRLTSGFQANLFVERTAIKIASIKQELINLVNVGLIEEVDISLDNFAIKPTQKGLNFLNEIVKQFVSH